MGGENTPSTVSIILRKVVWYEYGRKSNYVIEISLILKFYDNIFWEKRYKDDNRYKKSKI